MSAAMNRRDFLKVGAAGLGAAALAGMTGCATSSEAPVVADSATEWAAEADIVFVGSGTAGLYGAAAVAEEGGTAILLEKCTQENAGGDLRCYGGRFSPNPTERFIASSYGTMPQEDADYIAEISDEIQDWFNDNTNIEWVEGSAIAKGAGPAVYSELVGYFDGVEDIEFFYGTPGRKLVVDETGRVIGVQAGLDGEERNYKAKKGRYHDDRRLRGQSRHGGELPLPVPRQCNRRQHRQYRRWHRDGAERRSRTRIRYLGHGMVRLRLREAFSQVRRGHQQPPMERGCPDRAYQHGGGPF